MKNAKLFYDGKCPFCNQYSKLRELRECINLELYDAREDLNWMELDSSIKLDDGIILIIEDSKILQGVETIEYLDNICRFHGFIFRVQKIVFSNRVIGGVVYAILKWLRKIALFFTNERTK